MSTTPFILAAWLPLAAALCGQDRGIGGEAAPAVTKDTISVVNSYRIKGDYKTAERLLRESLASAAAGPLARRALQYNLADLLREEVRAGEAHQLFTELLTSPHERDVLDLKAMIGIADTDLLLGDSEGSIATWEKALSLSRERKDAQAEAIILRDLGRAWLASGSAARAEPLLKRSVHIAESNPDIESTQLAASLSVMGNYYLGEDKPSMAQELWVRVLSIQKEAFGENHPQVAYTMELLSQACGRLGENVRASDYATQASGIMSRWFGDDSIVAASALGNLAMVEEQIRAFADAATHYASAIRALRAYSELRSSTLILMQHYATVLKALRRNGEFKALQADIKAFSSNQLQNDPKAHKNAINP